MKARGSSLALTARRLLRTVTVAPELSTPSPSRQRTCLRLSQQTRTSSGYVGVWQAVPVQR